MRNFAKPLPKAIPSEGGSHDLSQEEAEPDGSGTNRSASPNLIAAVLMPCGEPLGRWDTAVFRVLTAIGL